MRYVNLTTAHDSYQAYFLKKALEDEGIQCMVINEYSSNIVQIPGSMGNMIQIRVIEDDLQVATNVINKLKANTDEIVCPNCGSKNVKLGFGFRDKFMRIVMLLLSFLFAAPPGRIALVYRCVECNTEFQKNKF
jgi:DNA-directed RNA polymerase subunit RPC12/RpoP